MYSYYCSRTEELHAISTSGVIQSSQWRCEHF